MTHVQAKITAMWDRASMRYDTFTGHGLNTERERRAWSDALRALLPPPPAGVLEVGTGTGTMAAVPHYVVTGRKPAYRVLSRNE
jgi:ubiquinone/menaquinone biosynthesis C-methylase UbiE